MAKWECWKCGACCKLAGLLSPELKRKDSYWCKHLQPDMTCGIYETRPDICRVDKMPPASDEARTETCKTLEKTFEGG